jgi:TolA-binding protein
MSFRQRRRTRAHPATWLLAAVIAAALCLTHDSRGAETTISEGTARYFRELRRRGLFRLAESYCLERLSHSGLSPAERADLTLELARALADHAALVAEPEQSELWNRARLVLADFLHDEPDNPRRILLEVQAAILPATIGHTRRWQAELAPFDETLARQGVESLNESIERLQALDANFADRVRKSPAAQVPRVGSLRGHEVRALAANVRYRLGSAELDLAQLFATDSPERSALLLDAQKLLKSIPEAGEESELVWMIRLAFVECCRLLGDPVRTLKELDHLEKQSPPPEVADALLAERVRTLMAQKTFSEGEALLKERSRIEVALPGELALLQIQLPVAQWQAGKARDEKLPPKLKQKLEERAASLRRDAGGYWADRADVIIQQLQDIDTYGPELAAIAARAQSAFSGGRTDEAIERFGEAAAKAHRDNRAELAFHFAYTRASIEIKARRWEDAAADLLELTELFPKNPRTPEAHLLAAYALGKAYDQKPTASRREEYTRALEEHRTRFGEGPTGPEATWMLSSLFERRGKISAALELYKSIPANHGRSAAAQIAVARSYEKILDRLRALGEPLDEWQGEAVDSLRKITGIANGASKPAPNAEPEVVVRLARIWLKARPPQFQAADRLLAFAEAVLEKKTSAEPPTAESPSPFADLRAQVRQLQVVSLAGQGRYQDARDVLQRLSQTKPAELLQILDGIAPLQSDDQKDPYHDLGKLQLEAALKLNEHRAALAAPQQRRLDECLARGFAATGEPARGIEIYEQLLARSPRDRSLLLAYARLLGKCGTDDCLKKALAIWQKLEAMYEAATPEWFAMRYETCRTLVLLHDPAEADKLLKVTRLLYPKIEDDQWQQKFADLEAASAKQLKEKSKKGGRKK